MYSNTSGLLFARATERLVRPDPDAPRSPPDTQEAY
jgi:hypothetical protein